MNLKWTRSEQYVKKIMGYNKEKGYIREDEKYFIYQDNHKLWWLVDTNSGLAITKFGFDKKTDLINELNNGYLEEEFSNFKSEYEDKYKQVCKDYLKYCKSMNKGGK